MVAVEKEKIAIRKVVDAINSNLQAHFPMKLEQEATDDLKWNLIAKFSFTFLHHAGLLMKRWEASSEKHDAAAMGKCTDYGLESVENFLIKLDMKPCMHLVKISICSINNVLPKLWTTSSKSQNSKFSKSFFIAENWSNLSKKNFYEEYWTNL